MWKGIPIPPRDSLNLSYTTFNTSALMLCLMSVTG